MEAATKCRKSILPGPTCPESLIHVAALHPYGVGLFQDHPLRLFPSNPLLGDLGGRTSKLTRTACAAQRHGNNRECVKPDGILDVGTSGKRGGVVSYEVYLVAVETSRSRSPPPWWSNTSSS
jgi:hypothetical protein